MMAKGNGDGSLMRVLEVSRLGSGSVWRIEEVIPPLKPHLAHHSDSVLSMSADG
jgi:hypothetical protein